MGKYLGMAILTLRSYREALAALRRQYQVEQITRVQNIRLQALVAYAYANIRYYHELFDHIGLKPEAIRSRQDLYKIPLLTKTELRNRSWDFWPADLPPCRVNITSGSTGTPVCILSDQNSRYHNSAVVIRCRKALGIGFFGLPILTPIKTRQDPFNKPAHWTFLQGFHKTYYVNPHNNSPENNRHVARLLPVLTDVALIGFTSAVRTLAYKVKDGIYPPIKPRIIITTGEVLTPTVRRLLESTFDSKVADIYACSEIGDIAWQCRQGDGYHINADNVIVEILRDEQPVNEGEVGEVVVTNLNRLAMPIIRFHTGDRARCGGGQCPCGRKLPMLSEIVGRSGDDIMLPDGQALAWNQLKDQMNHPLIRQFQLVQNADTSLTIKYISESDTDRHLLEDLILMRYRDLLGDSLSVRMQAVAEIPPAASGKIKLIISHLRDPN